jgi:hypothetical protein
VVIALYFRELIEQFSIYHFPNNHKEVKYVGFRQKLRFYSGFSCKITRKRKNYGPGDAAFNLSLMIGSDNPHEDL